MCHAPWCGCPKEWVLDSEVPRGASGVGGGARRARGGCNRPQVPYHRPMAVPPWALGVCAVCCPRAGPGYKGIMTPAGCESGTLMMPLTKGALPSTELPFSHQSLNCTSHECSNMCRICTCDGFHYDNKPRATVLDRRRCQDAMCCNVI